VDLIIIAILVILNAKNAVKINNIRYICQLCGKEFYPKNNDESPDCDSIEQTGRCADCFEEWGDQWTDRI